MHAKDNRLSNNGGAIVFTIKVVANMLFVVEDKTPDTLRLCSGQALRPCSGYTKVGRHAFEGDEERVSQEHGVPDLLLFMLYYILIFSI